jgi:hypothetical protein
LTTIRAGFLSKRGRVNRSWKIRYFILTSEALCYYTKDPVKDKGKKKGSLPTMLIQSVHRYTTEHPKTNMKEYHLDIISKDRKLMLKIESRESQIRWAVAIENSAPLVVTTVPVPLDARSARTNSVAAVLDGGATKRETTNDATKDATNEATKEAVDTITPSFQLHSGFDVVKNEGNDNEGGAATPSTCFEGVLRVFDGV